MCPFQKGHEVLLPHLCIWGAHQKLRRGLSLRRGGKSYLIFSAAQQSLFLPKRRAGRSPSLVSPTVHIFYRVVSRLSRRAGKQNHVGLNSIQHLLPFSHRKIPGPVSQLYSSISSKGYQLYACSNNSFVSETSIVNTKHMG